jgi:hypothetical protein
MEDDIRAALKNITVMTHLEPLSDPASWNDIHLDREEKTSSTDSAG